MPLCLRLASFPCLATCHTECLHCGSILFFLFLRVGAHVCVCVCMYVCVPICFIRLGVSESLSVSFCVRSYHTPEGPCLLINHILRHWGGLDFQRKNLERYSSPIIMAVQEMSLFLQRDS